MIQNPSPIALFVYARLGLTQRTVEALQRNHLAERSELIIFSDGPKSPAHAPKVAQVREYISSITGFGRVRAVLAEQNLGLSRSIIHGVTKIVNEFDQVIVLEDDLVTSPFFLLYMNEGLDRYANEFRVAAISGFHPHFDTVLPETFFQRDAECWGWATWKRAWDVFNPDGPFLLSELQRRKLLRQFNQDDSYPYVRMLEDQIAGRIDSWAIRWRASVFLNDMLSLYPGRSLTQNIGFDGSGTHGDLSDIWNDSNLSSGPIRVETIPPIHSDAAFTAFVSFNRLFWRKNCRDRLVRKLKRLVGRPIR